MIRPLFFDKREIYAFNFDVRHIFGLHRIVIKWFVCARALNFLFTTTFDGLVYVVQAGEIVCVR